MIGILAKEGEAGAVEEFFQLFKTPWEFWQPGRRYAVVLATRDEIPQDLEAEALIICRGHAIEFDRQIGVVAESLESCGGLEWQDIEFPVYGDVVALHGAGSVLLRSKETSKPTGFLVTGSERPVVRIGFDWFAEAAFLLSQGQPAKNARIPTLEIHIALLRAILETLQIAFVEVPAAPHGYDFAASLTHDVDFVGIRDHKFDRTTWGFLYRATLGSLLKALGGRLAWRKCLRNWKAAFSLPFVHLGLAKDFWPEFDRYQAIEREFGSTFFFLPFSNTPGRLGSESAPGIRAAKYDLADLHEELARLVESSCEIGLHGVDAWRDPQRARVERERIAALTAQPVPGIRMHWLYWDQNSPRILENAGFSYDSTFGYNDAVGFRAGTAQPFRPLDAVSLIELPLIIQDSAMFYGGRMNLSEADALRTAGDIIQNMASAGGALTINWHTRSLSPERLWGEAYATLLGQIRKHRVWFGTAEDVVAWFRARRALRFDSLHIDEHCVGVTITGSSGPVQPRFTVRIYDPRAENVCDTAKSPGSRWIEHAWNGEGVLEISTISVTGTPHPACV
ncbi:MAG TPA: hypothetical protein VME23_01255 [Terracidiphilus sp.]|nr:hypothetical protein [Terracidiphilus sp.]